LPGEEAVLERKGPSSGIFSWGPPHGHGFVSLAAPAGDSVSTGFIYHQ
jgi:hypothetical protein